jgi:monofunctional biosynthetic peptidoglycan transglycosylase
MATRSSLIKWLACLVPAVLAAGLVLYMAAIPDVARLKKENPRKTALMVRREAEWKARGRRLKVIQTWVPLSRVSPYMLKAVIIAEDDKFWSHEGFDFEAMAEAVEKDLKAGRYASGGSTISQQLVKNLYLSPRKSLLRKLREALITWRLEREISKRRILEIYLNVAEWGNGIFGVEAASRRYFAKPASGLTPAEAARLASVLPNPRRLDPSGDQRFVVKRAGFIYGIMVRRGIVVPEYEEVARAAEDALAPGPLPAPASPAEAGVVGADAQAVGTLPEAEGAPPPPELELPLPSPVAAEGTEAPVAETRGPEAHEAETLNPEEKSGPEEKAGGL